jgi:hypothetical protein
LAVKKCLASTMWRLWNIRHIPWICEPKKWLQKRRGVEKWFSGFQRLYERGICHCPMEVLWRKCCVNGCKVAYFCIINQLLEHFEVGVRWHYGFVSDSI